MATITETVELLQDGSQWFSGGVKEMRVSELDLKLRLVCVDL